MNEIVKYDNYLNGLKFTGFSPIDFNFLMALCSRTRDKNTNELKFTFDELREVTGYKQTSIKKFASDLERMNEKLMKIICKIKTETKTIMFVLFPTFVTDTEEQTLTVAVNEKFKFILNAIIKNFTRFDLDEFVQLNSKYSKSLYRLLKQFKSTGIFEVSIKDFREKMDCPVSYTNKHIMDKIIKPSLHELQNYFQNLQCTTKYAHKRGKPVIGYIFTFTSENRVIEADQSQDKMNKSDQSQQQKQNSFVNFHQRTYDYEQLERELINRSESDESQLDNEFIESQMQNILDEMKK